jgi:uncharacterized membrane protein
MKRLRRYLVAGLLVWLPLGVTLLLLKVLIDLMDQTLVLLPAAYRPEALFGFRIPGLGLVLSLTVLVVTGILVANLVGRQLVHWWESILQRIPLVRSVYSAAKNFAEIVLTDSSQSFKKVLLIEYPRKGLYSLCFQTSANLGEIQARTGEDVICVFVPTTPNPTSGLILMVPIADVIELDMDIEEALKMVVSLGVIVPQWKGEDAPAPPATASSES